VVRYLAGELAQRRTGLGPAALRDLPPPADQPTLTVQAVNEALAGIADLGGPGSVASRRHAFRALLARATAGEQRLLIGLITGDLRQGAAAGLMTEAVARAGAAPIEQVRAAVTLGAGLPAIATALLREGPSGLNAFALVVGRPLMPMLAQSASSVAEAAKQVLGAEADTGGAVGVEWKLDGIRVQMHRDGQDVALFSRTGDDITARLPEVVAAAHDLPVRQAVLDAEVLLLDAGGRPAPFQATASRTARRAGASTGGEPTSWSVTPMLFDALHVNGQDLIGQPAHRRWQVLADVTPSHLQVPRLVTADLSAAEAFATDALARGHEGVLVKAPGSTYQAGRRGAAWVKVKPVRTLDLLVLAAEWGHGRRTGWLSNLHLGALDVDGTAGPAGGFVMLGKTFKGLTDETLRWQTEHLLGLAVGPTDGWVVQVRPSLVAEIAFDGVQRSTRYPGGVALRFARLLRYREDKGPTDVDSLAAVRALLP